MAGINIFLKDQRLHRMIEGLVQEPGLTRLRPPALARINTGVTDEEGAEPLPGFGLKGRTTVGDGAAPRRVGASGSGDGDRDGVLMDIKTHIGFIF